VQEVSLFIGHYAVGFASKKLSPSTSLGLLILASLWLDIVWPFFVLSGIERAKIVPGITRVMPVDLEYYPFSHSLLAAGLWAMAFSGIYWFFYRRLWASLLLGIGVVSHWVLDLISHRPDLPLTFFGSQRLGLSLWNYPVPAFVLEFIIFAGSFSLYIADTRPLNAVGKFGIWFYAAILLGLFTVPFLGIIPRNLHVVVISGLFLFALIPIAHWLDRNRVPLEGVETPHPAIHGLHQ